MYLVDSVNNYLEKVGSINIVMSPATQTLSITRLSHFFMESVRLLRLLPILYILLMTS